jgi:TRAP-type transport system periplasmic protein
MNKVFGVLCWLVSLIIYALPSMAADVISEPIKLRWVVAHLPNDKLQDSVLKKFQKDVAKLTNKKVQVDLIYPPLNIRSQNWFEWGYEKIKNGEADVGQISTEILAREAPLLKVVDYPFLFKNYSHAYKVFDGDIGKGLLGAINTTNPSLTGVSFTFSGGFRVLLSNQEIKTSADLTKLMLPKPNNSILEKTEAALGIQHLGQDKGDMQNGFMDLHGSIYDYFYKNPKIVERLKSGNSKLNLYETNHNLFTTIIVKNNKSFSKFPDDLKNKLNEILNSLAIEERHLSVKAEDKFKSKLRRDYGVKLAGTSANLKEQMKQALQGKLLESTTAEERKVIQNIENIN